MKKHDVIKMAMLGVALALSGCMEAEQPHPASSQKVSGHNGVDAPGAAGAGTADGPSGGV